MSMWLSVCRVSPEAFAEIQKAPALIEALFFEGDASAVERLNALEIKANHAFGVDFLSLSAAYEGMAEAMGEEIGDDILVEDLNPSGDLDFEATYGPAFYLDPARVAEVAETSMIPEMEDDAKTVFADAVKNKCYFIGVVS